MSEISEPSNGSTGKPGDILRRILLIMAVLLIIGVAVCLFVFGWRETAGLIIGGALSFLNFYWLKASLGKMLGVAAETGAPEPTGLWLLRYNLRFLFLLIMIFGIFLTGIVSVVALFAGLLSLAMAIVVEGFIQLFLAVFKRGN
ncbi:MAG TPA: ATP synthase subunit I [Pyrinomonadaceae bacterium]|jgi:hypothetical protein|nr:ATP synthase subunit I [Pyrinomonadaceae bacterium]